MEKKKKQEEKTVEQQNPCDEYIQGWKKALADYDNLKKETEREKTEIREYALQRFLRDLLPVMQNFKQASTFIPQDQKENSWCTGIMYIQKQLMQVLENVGVSEISTQGMFDPSQHEVVGQEVSEKEEGTILKEKMSGYKLKEKVLIPAKVIIATKKN